MKDFVSLKIANQSALHSSGAWTVCESTRATETEPVYLKFIDFDTAKTTRYNLADLTEEARAPAGVLPQISWDLEGAKQRYQKLFEELHSQLVQNKIKKLVGVVGIEGQIVNPEFNFDDFAPSTNQTTNDCFQFIIKQNGSLIWGCSPELFCEWQESSKTLFADALAGTGPNSVELMRDDKQLREHQFVVDDISSVFESLAPTEISRTQAITFSSGITHLKTTLKTTPCHPIAEDLINKMHPTAALGCFPRKAYPLSKLYTGIQKRGPFGAPMGLHTPKGYVYWVNIRSLKIESTGKVFLPVGAGLLKESTFENEWQEILSKMKSTLRSLGLDPSLNLVMPGETRS